MASSLALVSFLLLSASALAQTPPLAITHVTLIDATAPVSASSPAPTCSTHTASPASACTTSSSGW